MRVLNVNALLDPVTGGGTAERTVQMSRFLSKAGVDCTILAMDLGLTAERHRLLEGIRVIALPCVVKRYYIPMFSIAALWKLIHSTDVIHLMGHWAILNAVVYWLARRLNKPYVVCPAGALPIYGRSKLLKRIFNWIVGKKIIRNARGHIAITPDEIPHFADYGVTSATIHVIPNGIDPEDFTAQDSEEFRKKHRLGNSPFILFVGRLNPIKGPDLLVRAFCSVNTHFPTYHLVLAGPDDGMLASLKQIALEHGTADKVHFIGYVGGSEKSLAYRASSLLVIPSRQEAMSIVALEAGITGTPVLLTDKCGFNEIENINGGRVVAATVEGLRDGLMQMLDNPANLDAMGARLEHYTRTHFIWSSIIEKYLNLYARILSASNN